MGVMSCSKKGCSNIMCNTYIDWIGYICDDCQDDFLLTKKSVVQNKEKLLANLVYWLNKPKKHYVKHNFDVKSFFNDHKIEW